jgi:two-component system, LytTR family, response regulator
MTKIRALIVDDEPIARRGIRLHLLGEADIEIIGECANGLEAVAAIQEQAPDLVFLDVQMPEMDGFEVIEAIGAQRMPVVIFVTAYDQYALRAFDAQALDYLLKPFDPERFHTALARAKATLEQQGVKEMNQQLLTLLKEYRGSQKYLERLVIKSAGRIYFLNVEEVAWIESADNYVCLHVGRQSHLLRETLNGLEAKLNPEEFLRIRHSAMVNLKQVKELQPLFRGEYLVVLKDGTELQSSRRYRKKVSAILGE